MGSDTDPGASIAAAGGWTARVGRWRVSLFWRIFALNAAVFGTGTVVLALSPATVSSPVLAPEAVVLAVGLLVILIANAVLLRVGLAPLDRLTRMMTTIDLLRPGQRLPVGGDGAVAELIQTFNDMVDRLEVERSASSGRALSAQEAERHRIAQELHDEIGQSLTAVLLELKGAVDRAPERLREELLHTQETARQSLDEVRRIARRLRPGVLEDLGLTSALAALATDFSGHTGLTVRRRLDATPATLSGDVELVIFRVTQEALTNIARHAHASKVQLELRQDDGAVELRVADDGRGIDHAPEGAGIRGMRERALLVGGDLVIESAPGLGAQVHLRVPLPEGDD